MELTYNYKAFAKINLFLHVLGKNNHGYHDLQSVVAFANIYDELSFKITNKSSAIKVSGEFAKNLLESCNGDKNIIIKAINFFNTHIQKCIALEVSLTKKLPLGAGIGGGSANCATTIIAINDIFKLGLSLNELRDIGMNFGADVPVCIENKICFMEKSGQQITFFEKINIDKKYVLLINPYLFFSTKNIFANINIPFSPEIKFLDIPQDEDIWQFIKKQGNDLLPYVIKNNIIIQEIVTNLNSTTSLPCGMSGSGSTCFALYKTKKEVDVAYKHMKRLYNNFWIKVAELIT